MQGTILRAVLKAAQNARYQLQGQFGATPFPFLQDQEKWERQEGLPKTFSLWDKVNNPTYPRPRTRPIP